MGVPIIIELILMPGRQTMKYISKVISNHGEGDEEIKPREVAE